MKPKTISDGVDPSANGARKPLGGSKYDEWNNRLSSLMTSALPLNPLDKETCGEAVMATLSGMIDINPADPIEGMIAAQLIAANEAALAMYRRAWQQPPENFEARTKYLALADKAARTVMLLTERLDHHRGRGQQKIVVQYTTVNADQAVVSTGNLIQENTGRAVSSPALLTASTEKPMPMLDETIQREVVPVGVGGGRRTK